MFSSVKPARGFTLIELMLAISILAVLSVIGTSIFNNLPKNARDSRRKADVDTIAKAFEVNHNPTLDQYQSLESSWFSSGGIPTPPEGGSYYYTLSEGNRGFRACAILEAGLPGSCSAPGPNCFCKDSQQGVFVAGATPPATPPPLGNATCSAPVTDEGDSNFIAGSRFTMGITGGTVGSISVNVGTVDASPNNQFQVAIYTDSGGSPATKLNQSSSGALTGNSWNTIPFPATTLSASTSYWLMYNTNGTDIFVNNLRFNTGGTASFTPQPFGSWPNPHPAGTFAVQTYCLYASFI